MEHDFSKIGPPDPSRFAARAEDIKMIDLGEEQNFLTPEQQAINDSHDKMMADAAKGRSDDKDLDRELA